MRARVPLDVDLEDNLLLGLNPQRFGYVAVAALAALAAWRAIPLGGLLAILCLLAGGALGWGRWRGRGLDHWLLASALWAMRTRRLAFDRRSWRRPGLRLRLAGRPRRSPSPSLPAILRDPRPIRRLEVLTGGDGDQ